MLWFPCGECVWVESQPFVSQKQSRSWIRTKIRWHPHSWSADQLLAGICLTQSNELAISQFTGQEIWGRFQGGSVLNNPNSNLSKCSTLRFNPFHSGTVDIKNTFSWIFYFKKRNNLQSVWSIAWPSRITHYGDGCFKWFKRNSSFYLHCVSFVSYEALIGHTILLTWPLAELYHNV